MPVIRVASGEGSRSRAGWQYRLIGSPISLSSVSVRMPANWAMRLRRGSLPKVSRSYQRKLSAMAEARSAQVERRQPFPHPRVGGSEVHLLQLFQPAGGFDQDLPLHPPAFQRGGIGHVGEADHGVARHEDAGVARTWV